MLFEKFCLGYTALVDIRLRIHALWRIGEEYGKPARALFRLCPASGVIDRSLASTVRSMSNS